MTITKSASTDNGIVSVIRDVEIKDGVTLVVPAINQLVISEGVTLTNNGTLDVRGSINAVDENNAAGEFGTETVDEDDNEYAVIANNGTIVSVSKMDYSKYQIAGAYYTINGKFYITPVEDAVAQIGNTETDSITVYGENTVGTVAFVGTVEEPVKVVLDATADITAESMTVTNGSIIAAAGAELDGTYGGSTGTVVLANMAVGTDGLTIEDKAVTVSEQTSQVTYVSGDLDAVTDTNNKLVSSVEFNGAVTVSKAELNIDMIDSDDETSVASGATLSIVGAGAKVITDQGMNVNGTLTVDDSGNYAGPLNVLGTLNVMGKTEKTSAGSITVGTLMIGASNFDYGADTAAAVNGDISGANAIYVFSQAVLDDAAKKVVEADGVDSTEFYVEDSLWMTVYDNGTEGIAITENNKVGDVTTLVTRIVPSELTNSVFGYWQTLKDGQYSRITTEVDVGDVDAVYASINYDIYSVTVVADPGIDAVYIDGKLMTKGFYDVYETGQLVEGFRMNISAGEHEITYKLGNYFSGEANMTVNGEAVTGNVFTTSGTDPEDTQVTIYLQGIEAAAPDTPTQGGSSSDGMGLTDYLLIILVVLIVVMAIMVALRLMRS